MINLPEEETQDEPWFIEPKDKDPKSELQRQKEVLAFCRRVAPSMRVWATVNAAKRSQWEAMRAKQEGMAAGIPDLTFVWNHGAFWAEMKDGKNMPSVPQREFLNHLYRCGFRCGVYRTASTLIEHLRLAGAPFIDRV